MFNRLRIAAIGAAYAFGLTSFFTYYTADHSNLLLASVLVIMLAHFLVAIGTIRTTLDVASGKRKNSDPSQQNPSPTIRLWKQAIRQAWPWHATLIVPKMGLSLAFMQYLYMDGIYWDFLDATVRWNHYHPLIGLTQPYNYGGLYHYYPFTVFPQFETALIALFVITLFAVANLSLLTTISLFWQQRTTKTVFMRTTLSRWLAAIMFIFTTFVSYPFLRAIEPHCMIVYRADGRCSVEDTEWQTYLRTYWRVIETIYTSSLSLADQGVLLSANIMRPIGENSAFTAQYDKYTATYQFDNRPFVLRQMVAAALGLGLYGLLTWGALRLAKRGDFQNNSIHPE